MPRKIASTKNANASRANGSPITDPQRPIRPGQNRPSAKDRTVPDTAPTAKRIASAFAHRRASDIHVASPLRLARYSAIRSRRGSPTPSAAKTMWNPSETAIWIRAACRLVSASTFSPCWQRRALACAARLPRDEPTSDRVIDRRDRAEHEDPDRPQERHRPRPRNDRPDQGDHDRPFDQLDREPHERDLQQ